MSSRLIDKRSKESRLMHKRSALSRLTDVMSSRLMEKRSTPNRLIDKDVYSLTDVDVKQAVRQDLRGPG